MITYVLVLLAGTLPIVFMVRRISDKEEYEWLLCMPFYFIAFAFVIYQLDIIFPGFLAR